MFRFGALTHFLPQLAALFGGTYSRFPSTFAAASRLLTYSSNSRQGNNEHPSEEELACPQQRQRRSSAEGRGPGSRGGARGQASRGARGARGDSGWMTVACCYCTYFLLCFPCSLSRIPQIQTRYDQKQCY